MTLSTFRNNRPELVAPFEIDRCLSQMRLANLREAIERIDERVEARHGFEVVHKSEA